MELLNDIPFDIEIPLNYDRSRGCAVADFSERGKPSRTSVLTVLVKATDREGTCVIAVRPHTGRKHQLRKHLSHVGLPIANDVKYNNINVIDDSGCSFGSPRMVSAFGLPNPPRELVKLFEDHYLDSCDHCKYVQELLGTAAVKQIKPLSEKRLSAVASEASRETIGPSISQPIWLHSWRYQFPSLGLSFEAPPPEWAQLCQSKDAFHGVLD